MHEHHKRHGLLHWALAVVLALGAWLSPNHASAQVSYGGQAQVLDADLELLKLQLLGGILKTNITLDLVKAGPLPSSGGFYHSHLLDIDKSKNLGHLLFNAELAHALTSGNGYDSYSESFVAELNLGIVHKLGQTLKIEATVIKSKASAMCKAGGGASLSGKSYLAALKINGKAISITGKPNQTLDLAGIATIIINEQKTSSSSTGGAITVNALHVKLIDKSANLLTYLLSELVNGAVVVGHAQAAVNNCPSTEPPCPNGQSCTCEQLGTCPPCSVKDFVTGGGQVGSGSSKVSFSTHGGLSPSGSLKGGFNVVNHGNGQHIRPNDSNSLFAYADPSAPSTKRQLKFYCNAGNGVCVIDVADNGEPGNDGAGGTDTWQLSSMGLSTLGSTSNPISHGNIQLHQPRGCSVIPSGDGGGSTGGGGKGGGKGGSGGDSGGGGKGGGKK